MFGASSIQRTEVIYNLGPIWRFELALTDVNF